MTRLLLMALFIVVLLAPTDVSTAFESPLVFESPLPAGGDDRITAQVVGCVYLLPTVRIGDPTE